MTYQQWLKRERQRAGLSQELLGLRAGLGRSYVNKIERGKVELPNYETRLLIHSVLGTTEYELRELGIVRAQVIQVPTAHATVEGHAPTVVTGETPELRGTIRGSSSMTGDLTVVPLTDRIARAFPELAPGSRHCL